MSEIDNARLERIENKVDTMVDAISRLAVVDARLSDFIQSNSRTAARVSALETEVASLQTQTAIQDVKVDILVRICWGLGAGVATALGTVLSKILGIL